MYRNEIDFMRRKRTSPTASCLGFLFALPFFPFILIFEVLKRFPKFRSAFIAFAVFLTGTTAASELIAANRLDASFVLALLLIVAPIIYAVAKLLVFLAARYEPRFVARPMVQIDSMSGLEFEEYVASLLKKSGYSNVEVTKASGDQGVDILAEKDGLRYAIQCKNYFNKLGNAPVQEVYAGRAFYGCDVAVVVTNSTFTSSARELADAVGVLLWDRSTLQQMVRDASGRKTRSPLPTPSSEANTPDTVPSSSSSGVSDSPATPVKFSPQVNARRKERAVDPEFIAAAQWYAARDDSDAADDE